jgi:hypothetical protein
MQPAGTSNETNRSSHRTVRDSNPYIVLSSLAAADFDAVSVVASVETPGRSLSAPAPMG